MYLPILLNAIKKILKMVYNKGEEHAEQLEILDSLENSEDLENLEDFEESEEFDIDDIDDDLESSPVAALELRILSNGNLSVSCGWSEETENIAHTYGYMLALLNSGGIKAEILKALYSHMKKDESHTPFITAVLESWEDTISNTPMKPSEVFSNE